MEEILGGLHSNKSRPELTVSRLTARNALRVATRIVIFLVWLRPELSCVVTRNETLSGFRNYMTTRAIFCRFWTEDLHATVQTTGDGKVRVGKTRQHPPRWTCWLPAWSTTRWPLLLSTMSGVDANGKLQKKVSRWSAPRLPNQPTRRGQLRKKRRYKQSAVNASMLLSGAIFAELAGTTRPNNQFQN